ncbi:MAG: D-alanine--D-alanine ligase [Pseudomonadota bacterium]
MTQTIAVLMGGPSAEAEVSRRSAAEVAGALKESDFAVALVELDSTVTETLLALRPDVVFPALHGPPGEDGTVQGYLEILGLPYVGSDVHGSAAAMDKALAKAVFRRVGLPVAEDLVFPSGADSSAAAETVLEHLGDRVVIKPLAQGSAIGVTPIANGGDLKAPLEAALALGDGVLVEPYVLGREITVGVLDLHGEAPEAFPVIEIRTAQDQWYDYENRYAAGGSEHVIPAPMPEALTASLQQIAREAHVALGLRDLSRADFIVTDSDEIVLLEVNSLPGMTPTSLYPDGARAVGISFPELVARLVKSAAARAAATLIP